MRVLSKEELLALPPATHFVKTWSGTVDPKISLADRLAPLAHQRAQGQLHEPQYGIFRYFENLKLILDVGANCGQSIISFKTAKPAAAIKSFEPHPMSFELALAVSQNFRNCEVFNFGLSDQNARLPIFTPVIDGLLITPLTSLDKSVFEPGGTMHKFTTDNIAKGAEVSLYQQEIELKRGDDLGLSPDVIKIDVEGAELAVLQGFERTIGRNAPLIMVEKSDAHSVAAYLMDLGYQSYRYEAEQPGSAHVLRSLPITPSTNGDAIPLNVVYVHHDRIEPYRERFGLEFQ